MDPWSTAAHCFHPQHISWWSQQVGCLRSSHPETSWYHSVAELSAWASRMHNEGWASTWGWCRCWWPHGCSWPYKTAEWMVLGWIYTLHYSGLSEEPAQCVVLHSQSISYFEVELAQEFACSLHSSQSHGQEQQCEDTEKSHPSTVHPSRLAQGRDQHLSRL